MIFWLGKCILARLNTFKSIGEVRLGFVGCVNSYISFKDKILFSIEVCNCGLGEMFFLD